MSDESRNPDPDKDGIPTESFEDVPLAVDLAGVDLIEQRHHHKRVEDDREMLRWWSVKRLVSSAVDVEHYLTFASSRKIQLIR